MLIIWIKFQHKNSIIFTKCLIGIIKVRLSTNLTFFMTLLPIIEKLEELKANDIYGAEIVDAIKSSNLSLYFYYDGFVGLTDNQVDCKD